MPTANSISFKKMYLTKHFFFCEGFHYYFIVYINTYVSQFHGNWNSFGPIFDDGEKFRLKSVAAKSSRFSEEISLSEPILAT